MALTDIQNFTQLTNLRVIPNRDLGTNYNIGLGTPNYGAELPDGAISKPGDIAFSTTLDRPVIFTATNGWRTYNNIANLNSYGGFYMTVNGDPTLFPANIFAPVPMGDASAYAEQGMTVTEVGGTFVVTNTSGAAIKVAATANLSLFTTDRPGLEVIVAMSYNNTTGASLPGGHVLISIPAVNKTVACCCTAIFTLQPNDNLRLVWEPTAEATLQAVYASMVVNQISTNF